MLDILWPVGEKDHGQTNQEKHYFYYFDIFRDQRLVQYLGSQLCSIVMKYMDHANIRVVVFFHLKYDSRLC